MDWIGSTPPVAAVIEGRKVLAFGETHIEGLLQDGRKILGWRSLGADGLHPGLMRTGFEGECLGLGLEFLRKATHTDKAQIAECPLWNKNGIKIEVQQLLGVACATPEARRKRSPTRLNFDFSPGLDGRAVQILMDAYWSNGCRENPAVTPEDLAYARQAGVMFDPIVLRHDEIISRLVLARAAVTKEQVANAFLASLSRRRLDLRSALGYAMPARCCGSRRSRMRSAMRRACMRIYVCWMPPPLR